MSGVFDFQLSPYVYPFVKNNNVLLLNTKDMNAMIFNEEEHIAAFMRELLSLLLLEYSGLIHQQNSTNTVNTS